MAEATRIVVRPRPRRAPSRTAHARVLAMGSSRTTPTSCDGEAKPVLLKKAGMVTVGVAAALVAAAPLASASGRDSFWP